jgi:uncharacterized protein YjeT (DUF2065 family)
MIEEKIRILCIASFIILGLSHILQPKAWISFFKLLIKQHLTGSFINGFITLPMGVIIISFHNVWTGVPVLLTVMGWAYILKATIAFCIPSLGLRSMKRVERNNLNEFRIGGIILLIIASVLIYSFFQ